MLNTRQHLIFDIKKYGDLEERIVTEMLRLFRGDNRRVMQQRSTGGYGVLHSGPLSTEDLKQHLRGDVSVSIYLLDENGLCATLCFDIDIPKIKIPESAIEREKKKRAEFLPIVTQIVRHIQSTYSVPDEVFLLEDTGGRGYHVWLFFKEPQPADSVIMLAHEVKRSVGAESIESFPPSPKHGPSGYSKSNVRLPLGLHRKYPGTYSVFLDLRSYEKIPVSETLTHLRKVKFVSADILDMAGTLVTKQAEVTLSEAPKEPIEVHKKVRRRGYIANVGEMLSLCPALSGLVVKAQRDGHLDHHERIALALTLMHCSDGEERLHKIMSYCSDYSVDETQRHINSLEGYYPISCRRLQGIGYDVCSGWCCPQLKKAAEKGHSPTPLWFSRLIEPRENIKTDGSKRTLIERIASIDNLHQAWKQARVQARERDIFEDVSAYQAFEEHLWANLHVLRADLLSGIWQQQPFRVVRVPKTKADLSNARPMCWATPWDSIVALAVLNVIGPPIDSTFHKNSLGNRLARGPKADGQVFEDWRKQNLYREIRREGFSEYPEDYYYVLTDITRFFEFVRHDRLMTLLRKYIDDQKVLAIIQQFLEAEWLLNDSALPRASDDGSLTGLPQGPLLSAFLANLYLEELDHWLEKTCVDFVRYVDDLALLFESKENAEEIVGELRKVLKEEFSLELSHDPTKTLGPFPATETTALTDWIRDARYELVKYSRRAGSLTVVEKNEMRVALAVVAGASLNQQSDMERLVKYLGFYIANTEKLEQLELQRGVYALALYVLNEQRPKHNATCIAMRALIKACREFGDPAWRELKELLQSRQDDYIRIVFAQETRRFIEDDNSELTFYSKLLNEIEEQAASSLPVSAATAITCLASIGNTSAKGRDTLWNILMGDDGYLRPRAAMVLSRLGALTSTAAARIFPECGDEAALFLFSLQSVQSKAVIDSLAEALEKAPIACHAVPALLFASFGVGSEKGVATCANIGCLSTAEYRHHICHHVATKYVKTVIIGQNQGSDLEYAIRIGVKSGLPTVARQLYDLGRFSRVIAELPEIDSILSQVEGELVVATGVPTLPTIKGISLGKLLISISPGVWLHEATSADGTLLYHEVVTGSELESLGQNAAALIEVLNALGHSNLLLVDKTDIKREHGAEYAIAVSTKNDEWRTVAEWIRDSGTCDAQEKALIVRKAVELLDRSRGKLRQQDLSLDLLPVPTCHTLVINTAGELRFRNITATIAGGQQYVGLSRHSIELPREHWIVFALGLLFFEVVTGKCAVLAMQDALGKKRIAETGDCQARGALFAGIIGKATANRPDSRYNSPQLFLNDVEEWCRLEMALDQHDLGRPRTERLRHLWHIQLGLERRTHLAVQEQRSFLDAASRLATYVLEGLDEGGELKDDWLQPKLMEIVIQRGVMNAQVTALQTHQLVEALQEQWTDLTRAVHLQRPFTCQDWLKCAAATNEIETARRVLCMLAKSTLRSVCEHFCVTVDTSILEGRKLRVGLPDSYQAEYEDEVLIDLANGLATASERLLKWLDKPIPDALWPTDLLVIATLLSISTEGLVLQGSNDYNVQIGPVPDFRLSENVRKATLSLLRLYGHNLRKFATASKDAESVHQAADLALLCGRLLYQLNLTQRLFRALPKSAFQELYTDRLAELDLAPVLDRRGEQILASNSSLLPFPNLSPFLHREGCLFGVDLIELEDGTLKVVALSLPPVVYQREDGVICPTFREELSRKQVRRAWRVKRCVLGRHLFFLLPIPGLFLLQVYLRNTGLINTATWASALDSYIPNLVTGVFLWPYIRAFIKRLKLNEAMDNTNR